MAGRENTNLGEEIKVNNGGTASHHGAALLEAFGG
jgi:hypothetical protein